MEDNKIKKFSPQVEESYQKQTEENINLSEGFTSKVMEKIKTEQAKKRNNIIKWVSAAAAFVIVVGVIAVAPKLLANKTAPESTADENYNYSSLSDNAAEDAVSTQITDQTDTAGDSEQPAEHTHKGAPVIPNSQKIPTEIDRENINARQYALIKKLVFAFDEDHKLNWYEFYNACIDGTAGDDTAAILSHARICFDAFTEYGLTTEAAQANEIISAIEGSGTN